MNRQESKNRTPASILHRIAIIAFILTHFISTLWGLIPDYLNSLYSSNSSAPMIAIKGIANTLVTWKYSHINSFWATFLEKYSTVTSSYQYWNLFAPDPHHFSTWVSVFAIQNTVSKSDNRASRTEKVPIYSSFTGSLQDRLTQHIPFNDNSYKFSYIMNEILLNKNRHWETLFLDSYAKYWAKKYFQNYWIFPNSIEIIVKEAEISTPFTLFNSKDIPIRTHKCSIILSKN